MSERSRIIGKVIAEARFHAGIPEGDGPTPLETTLGEDLGFDSLDVVEFSVALEDAFGDTFVDAGAEEVFRADATLREIVDYIAARTIEPEPERTP